MLRIACWSTDTVNMRQAQHYAQQIGVHVEPIASEQELASVVADGLVVDVDSLAMFDNPLGSAMAHGCPVKSLFSYSDGDYRLGVRPGGLPVLRRLEDAFDHVAGQLRPARRDVA